MPCHYSLLTLLLTIGGVSFSHSADSTGQEGIPNFVILRVENMEPDTNHAKYLAVGNTSRPWVIWNEAPQSIILESNPYALYYKGNHVGTYTAIRIEEDEIASWLMGVTTLFEGLKPSDLDSLGAYSFTAISQKHILKSTCKQPRSYDYVNFVADLDCDGKDDLIRTKVTQASGTIDLLFGSGSIQHIDTVEQDGRLESIFVLDIFDLDNDGSPEILTTFNTYPSFSYVLYRYSSGRWRRTYEALGGGC